MLSDDSSDAYTSESGVGSSGGGIFIPIAIGLVGIILGGVALYIALNGSGKYAEAQATIAAASEQAASLEARITGLETAIANLKTETSGQETRLRTMASQTQTALNQVGQEINSTRQQVTAMGKQIQEAIGKLNTNTRAASTVARPQVSDTNTATAATSNAPESSAEETDKVHTISSGDTFARLSSRYNVSVDDILEANPDADPRRLQIGQKIKIPGSSHSRE